jgi:periplasmic divalent cation tolerance protein
MQHSQVVVVLVTTSGVEESERLARVLLDLKLIACANVVPLIRSFFRWEGRLEGSDESLLIMKTTDDVLERLAETVKRHHSYDVPEIIALPLAWGSPEYLSWVAGEVRSSGPKAD